MIRRSLNNNAVALFIVLSTILVVVILANIVLNIMLSQSRLTHHQVSRIQAYYADLAGMNYAFDRIRANDTYWIPSPGTLIITRRLCRGCIPPDVDEPNLPASISQINITVGALGSGIDGTRAVNVTAVYNSTF